MKSRQRLLAACPVFSLVLLLLAVGAFAGPPLICHTLEIGSAKSLPWISHGWNLTGSETYDTTRLVNDTVAALAADKTVIVHMETLRRATLYARKDPAAAKELLSRITMDTKAPEADQDRALRYFDAGYLVEAYKQWIREPAQNPAVGLDGYALVKQAIRLRGSDPEMEFAAALITLSSPGTEHAAHVQKAISGASSDTLLARNLSSHFIGPQDPTIREMLTKTTVAEKQP
jgi:hypothetical protein